MSPLPAETPMHASTDSPILVAEGLSKRFGDVVAVDALSFHLYKGDVLGLLGPNGAGKTTVIQLLLGILTPTSGSARLFGLEVRRHRRAILQRVNFSSTYVSLPTNLTVRENLTVFARLYGLRKPQRKIRTLLELFDIAPFSKRLTGALSSGQLTRLHLCKALLNDPDVLFLDEPTASLDPDIAVRVRQTLRRLQQARAMTMIYTSHNMQEIEIMCDRLMFLSRGRLVMQGSTQEVLRRARHASLEDVFISLARTGELRDVVEAAKEPPCGDA
jgi:ABC-2 type transport system ATP-binding protein